MVVFNGLGQQQHYFDSRLTYHASRSAMGVGMGAAGYPLTNTWAHQYQTAGYPASAYLGYNTAVAGAGVTSYSASSALPSPYSGGLDPGSLGLVSGGAASGPGSAALTSDSASPAGNDQSHLADISINTDGGFPVT